MILERIILLLTLFDVMFPKTIVCKLIKNLKKVPKTIPIWLVGLVGIVLGTVYSWIRI